ncbi:hypothetical protein SLE2022_245800 [Rubroshorea leprosula]
MIQFLSVIGSRIRTILDVLENGVVLMNHLFAFPSFLVTIILVQKQRSETPSSRRRLRGRRLIFSLHNSSGMAGRAQIATSNSALIAMIADEDTVVGFLLAGVGNVDLRRKTNYLIVDSKTTVKQIEDTFKEFTAREDIAIVLISQYVANMIRFLVDSYNKPVPAILEIPSKDHPYDPAHDSVLSRVKYLFSTESVASGRR